LGDLWKLGITGLSRAYANGVTDPVEVTRDLLARIIRIDPALNAFAALSKDAGRDAADSAARLREGRARSPLEGVPIAAKDNLRVAGMPAAWGSAVFADAVPVADEIPVARLRAAGAVILGKTRTPEFSVDGHTASEAFGVTRNPWNPALTPGGSSGGSAAAVAAGLAAAGIGTDGGGSIRRPAGHTGLYGMKPTIGAVARGGGLPQLLLDFEVIGGLTRTASDLRLLHAALAGPDRRDPRSRFAPDQPPPGHPLRVLLVERLGGAPCDPSIRASLAGAAARLSELGHEVVAGPLPFDLEPLNAAWPDFARIGLAWLRSVTPGFAAHASANYVEMADAGDRVPATALYAALDAVRRLRAEVSVFLEEWDAIVTPSAAAQPWPAGEAFPTEIDGVEVGPRGHAVFTGWVNLCGHPAITVPAAPDGDGMPIGVQIIGDLFAEETLLDLAGRYEAGGPGWRWPALSFS
jgi:aspartyl-tRNA(Asn)/glutamyl-tRNA(Gln) amidotransferase subunit A